ncbi:MAG: hypothetical protein J0G32_04415 [Alphaproteobacteria bacterium]|nr:hypothetical protein [Alphaproteobacteria bacterium]OJV15135.1 MAG: hypothetical protein BGO27_06835 [Alphaproteobacteria bacterium 33-17]
MKELLGYSQKKNKLVIQNPKFYEASQQYLEDLKSLLADKDIKEIDVKWGENIDIFNVLTFVNLALELNIVDKAIFKGDNVSTNAKLVNRLCTQKKSLSFIGFNVVENPSNKELGLFSSYDIFNLNAIKSSILLRQYLSQATWIKSVKFYAVPIEAQIILEEFAEKISADTVNSFSFKYEDNKFGGHVVLDRSYDRFIRLLSYMNEHNIPIDFAENFVIQIPYKIEGIKTGSPKTYLKNQPKKKIEKDAEIVTAEDVLNIEADKILKIQELVPHLKLSIKFLYQFAYEHQELRAKIYKEKGIKIAQIHTTLHEINKVDFCGYFTSHYGENVIDFKNINPTKTVSEVIMLSEKYDTVTLHYNESQELFNILKQNELPDDNNGLLNLSGLNCTKLFENGNERFIKQLFEIKGVKKIIFNWPTYSNSKNPNVEVVNFAHVLKLVNIAFELDRLDAIHVYPDYSDHVVGKIIASLLLIITKSRTSLSPVILSLTDLNFDETYKDISLKNSHARFFLEFDPLNKNDDNTIKELITFLDNNENIKELITGASFNLKLWKHRDKIPDFFKKLQELDIKFENEQISINSVISDNRLKEIIDSFRFIKENEYELPSSSIANLTLQSINFIEEKSKENVVKSDKDQDPRLVRNRVLNAKNNTKNYAKAIEQEIEIIENIKTHLPQPVFNISFVGDYDHKVMQQRLEMYKKKGIKININEIRNSTSEQQKELADIYDITTFEPREEKEMLTKSKKIVNIQQNDNNGLNMLSQDTTVNNTNQQEKPKLRNLRLDRVKVGKNTTSLEISLRSKDSAAEKSDIDLLKEKFAKYKELKILKVIDSGIEIEALKDIIANAANIEEIHVKVARDDKGNIVGLEDLLSKHKNIKTLVLGGTALNKKDIENIVSNNPNISNIKFMQPTLVELYEISKWHKEHNNLTIKIADVQEMTAQQVLDTIYRSFRNLKEEHVKYFDIIEFDNKKNLVIKLDDLLAAYSSISEIENILKGFAEPKKIMANASWADDILIRNGNTIVPLYDSIMIEKPLVKGVTRMVPIGIHNKINYMAKLVELITKENDHYSISLASLLKKASKPNVLRDAFVELLESYLEVRKYMPDIIIKDDVSNKDLLDHAANIRNNYEMFSRFVTKVNKINLLDVIKNNSKLALLYHIVGLNLEPDLERDENGNIINDQDISLVYENNVLVNFCDRTSEGKIEPYKEVYDNFVRELNNNSQLLINFCHYLHQTSTQCANKSKLTLVMTQNLNLRSLMFIYSVSKSKKNINLITSGRCKNIIGKWDNSELNKKPKIIQLDSIDAANNFINDLNEIKNQADKFTKFTVNLYFNSYMTDNSVGNEEKIQNLAEITKKLSEFGFVKKIRPVDYRNTADLDFLGKLDAKIEELKVDPKKYKSSKQIRENLEKLEKERLEQAKKIIEEKESRKETPLSPRQSAIKAGRKAKKGVLSQESDSSKNSGNSSTSNNTFVNNETNDEVDTGSVVINPSQAPSEFNTFVPKPSPVPSATASLNASAAPSTASSLDTKTMKVKETMSIDLGDLSKKSQESTTVSTVPASAPTSPTVKAAKNPWQGAIDNNTSQKAKEKADPSKTNKDKPAEPEKPNSPQQPHKAPKSHKLSFGRVILYTVAYVVITAAVFGNTTYSKAAKAALSALGGAIFNLFANNTIIKSDVKYAANKSRFKQAAFYKHNLLPELWREAVINNDAAKNKGKNI